LFNRNQNSAWVAETDLATPNLCTPNPSLGTPNLGKFNHGNLTKVRLTKVLAVNKVLRAPFFMRNFETEKYTSEKHEIKSFDLQGNHEFGFSFFVVSRFVPKLRKFEKMGARNTFLNDGTTKVHLTPLQTLSQLKGTLANRMIDFFPI